MLTKRATLQLRLQDISERKFASVDKSTCARNPSLRGSQGMEESSYVPYLVKSGTISGLESAHLILDWQLVFLPAIPDWGTRSPFAHTAGIPSHGSLWISTCFMKSSLWQGRCRTAALLTAAKLLINSKHLQVLAKPMWSHPPQLWVEGSQWTSGVVTVGPWGFDSTLICIRGSPHHFKVPSHNCTSPFTYTLCLDIPADITALMSSFEREP